MNFENQKEIFAKASSSKAMLNSLIETAESDLREKQLKKIRENMEQIERRSDPVHHPDYERD